MFKGESRCSSLFSQGIQICNYRKEVNSGQKFLKIAKLMANVAKGSQIQLRILYVNLGEWQLVNKKPTLGQNQEETVKI